MASLLRTTIQSKGDDMSPTAVEARVRNLGDACASEHGGRPADFSLGAYRIEYERLHAQHVSLIERYTDAIDRLNGTSTDFWPDDADTLLDMDVYQDGPDGPVSGKGVRS